MLEHSAIESFVKSFLEPLTIRYREMKNRQVLPRNPPYRYPKAISENKNHGQV